jgi:hypothetical protein
MSLGCLEIFGCGAAATKGKGLTPWLSSTIVPAMNGHNHICGIIRSEIIR